MVNPFLYAQDPLVKTVSRYAVEDLWVKTEDLCRARKLPNKELPAQQNGGKMLPLPKQLQVRFPLPGQPLLIYRQTQHSKPLIRARMHDATADGISVPVVTVNGILVRPVATDRGILAHPAVTEHARQETASPVMAIVPKGVRVAVMAIANPAQVARPVRVVTAIVLKGGKVAVMAIARLVPAVAHPVKVVTAIVPKAVASVIVQAAHPAVVRQVKAVLVIVPRLAEAHPVSAEVVKTSLRKPNRLRTINAIYGHVINKQIQSKIKRKPNAVRKTAKVLTVAVAEASL